MARSCEVGTVPLTGERKDTCQNLRRDTVDRQIRVGESANNGCPFSKCDCEGSQLV